MSNLQKTDQTMRRLYTLLLALALCAYVLTNLCVRLADDRFGLSLDMTQERLYELSELTGEACAWLSEPVCVYVVSAQSDYPAMLREMLSRYTRLSPLISVEYVDPYANPVFLEHYAQMGLQLEEGDLLVEGAVRSKTVSYGQLLLTDAQGEITGIDLEQQLTSALLYVNNDAMPQAAFITGLTSGPPRPFAGCLKATASPCATPRCSRAMSTARPSSSWRRPHRIMRPRRSKSSRPIWPRAESSSRFLSPAPPPCRTWRPSLPPGASFPKRTWSLSRLPAPRATRLTSSPCIRPMSSTPISPITPSMW